jgi:hypothetical protein
LRGVGQPTLAAGRISNKRPSIFSALTTLLGAFLLFLYYAPNSVNAAPSSASEAGSGVTIVVILENFQFRISLFFRPVPVLPVNPV